MVNRVLLTGAGFTHNFGAPLASEMSDLIFNNPLIQSNQILKEKLQYNFDYESIYHEVMSEGEDHSEKKILLQEAVEEAYRQVDQRIINSPLSQTNFDMFSEMISRFQRRREGSGYIFTLNQDLYFERFRNIGLSLMRPIFGRENLDYHNNPLTNLHTIDIPTGDEFQRRKNIYENTIPAM